MELLEHARETAEACQALDYEDPVAWTYNPLDYAWEGYRAYLERFASEPKDALFVGMNPGPWGMGQTGVPFGDVDCVRDRMSIDDVEIGTPAKHREDERPVHGLDCPRNERSGTRLYEGLAERFGTLEQAYGHLFVANYCPLLFFDEEASNITPPRLRKADREALFELCDEHLSRAIEHLDPDALVGVGRFAERRIEAVLEQRGEQRQVEYLLHPSPANPMANKDGGDHWRTQLDEALDACGLDEQRAVESPDPSTG
jgi:single-strand selective monofunctional uracil DNA glycosylase